MPRQTLTSYIKRAGDEMLDKIFHFVVAEMNRRKAAKQNVDVGFWDSDGNYTEDIQEIGQEELKNHFVDLNKMVDSPKQALEPFQDEYFKGVENAR